MWVRIHIRFCKKWKANFIATSFYITKLFNFPNPFNPNDRSTELNYLLGEDSDVAISIYDLLGNSVREINFSAGQNGGRAGQNIIAWDGKNGAGDFVGNGGYLVRMSAKGVSGTNSEAAFKMAVAR